MTAELQTVLRLQDLDLRGAELRKEIAALPRHTAQIEKVLDQHLRKLEADRAALAANQRDRKRLEDDAKIQEPKLSKLKDQMLQAKTNDQYRAFQSEIQFCETEIRKIEDKILELMLESESLEKNVKAAEAALKVEKDQVEKEKAHARARTAEDQNQYDQLQAERKNLVAALDAKVYSSYERIRRKWGGIAVADASEGRCSACMIALRPQYYQDLKKAEQLQLCESCGRILYYTPPVDLEHELHEQPR
ncbi:MAG: hypothetical protein HYS04_17350 [Acidobacteria bacterium]|nr:hypothetical protein [Acidobacteriota bacterium]